EVFWQELGLELDDPSTPFGWYGLSSISYVRLARRIEESLQVRMEPHQFYAARSLEGLRAWISRGGRLDAPGPVPAAPAARRDGDLAIVGMAATFPRGLDAAGLWEALMARADLISKSSREYLGDGAYAGFLDQIDKFD